MVQARSAEGEGGGLGKEHPTKAVSLIDGNAGSAETNNEWDGIQIWRLLPVGNDVRMPARHGRDACGREDFGERVQTTSPEGADRAADPLRPAGPPAGAGGAGREAARRDRAGQGVPVPVRLLPTHRVP